MPDTTQRPWGQTPARSSRESVPKGMICLRSDFFSFLKVLQGGVVFSHHQSRISTDIAVNEENPVTVCLFGYLSYTISYSLYILFIYINKHKFIKLYN